jgi:hypothetical protein
MFTRWKFRIMPLAMGVAGLVGWLAEFVDYQVKFRTESGEPLPTGIVWLAFGIAMLGLFALSLRFS